MYHFSVVLLMAISLTACQNKPAVPAKPRPVKIQNIVLEKHAEISEYSGEVRARYERRLSFQVGGKVLARQVEVGSQVVEGDILMQLDPNDLQLNLDSKRSELLAAESGLKLAQADFDRYQDLYQRRIASKADFEKIKSSYETAEARLKQARAQYQEGLNQTAYGTLRAEQAGVIVSIEAEVNQVVSPGQVVLTLASKNDKEILINVPENRISDAKNAEQLEIRFWAYPNLHLKGKIREIAPDADKITRTYATRITIFEPPEDLQLGMSATVKVTNPTKGSIIRLPLSALYQVGNNPVVWVVKEDTVHQVPIVVEQFSDNFVEISAGLQAGECVVIAGVHKLVEGQKVRILGQDE